MSGSIILYAAGSRLTDEHNRVHIWGTGRAVYVRAVHLPGVAPIDALDHAKPLERETFLNSIPDDFAR